MTKYIGDRRIIPINAPIISEILLIIITILI